MQVDETSPHEMAPGTVYRYLGAAGDPLLPNVKYRREASRITCRKGQGDLAARAKVAKS